MKKTCFHFFLAFIISVLFAAAFEIIKLVPLAIAFGGIGIVCLVTAFIFFVIGQIKGGGD